MKRETLLASEGYWTTNIQNELFGIIDEYMTKKNINRSQLATQLKVSKGYITQVMNGDFDHKLSKLVELSLACDKIPVVFFVDKDEYIKADDEDKVYAIVTKHRSKVVTFNKEKAVKQKVKDK